MSNLDLIAKLRQILDDLKVATSKLDADINELKKQIEEERFIPLALSACITQELAEVSSKQKDLETQFETLEAGTIPENISEISALLDKCKEKAESIEKYLQALEFFMNIRSNDEEAQAVIEKRKEEIRNAKLKDMTVPELKEFAECYLWLLEAHIETDPEKKFSLTYKVVGSFEEPFIKAAHFGNLIFQEEILQAEGEEISTEDSEATDKYHDSDDNNDALNEKKNDESQNDETENGENPINVEADKVSLDEEELKWETLGIEEPDAVILHEDKETLSVDQSVKATAKLKFSVKEFKRDITKQAQSEKTMCLVEALEGCGYTRKSISLWKNKEDGFYDLATEKLWQLGYLKRYSVKSVGEFYTLSARGEKAFTSKESLSFINNHLRYRISSRHGREIIEDSTNSAIARLLAFKSFELVDKIHPGYLFYSKTACMATDYAFVGFPDVIDEKQVVFFGIASEEIDEFKKAYDYISDDRGEADHYVISGITHENAMAIAKWVVKVTEGSVPVWYSGISDDAIYDAVTDEEIEIPFVTEDAEDEDLEETDFTETTSEEMTDKESITENTDGEVEPAEIEGGKEHQPSDNDELTSGEVPVQGSKEETDQVKGDISEEIETTVTESHTYSMIEAASEKKLTDEIAETVKDISVNAPEKSASAPITNSISEEKKQKHNEEYEKMLVAGWYYGATAYVKSLANEIPYYTDVYNQLAYALNDPMGSCSYSSDNVYRIYYGDALPVSEYFTVSAVMRNFFYDQFSYDYSLQQLQAVISGNLILQEEPLIESIVYTLQKFKKDNHKGIDRYTDYREKGRSSWEIKLKETYREARDYYENYSTGNVKENASHKRFIETQKLLLGPESEISDYLKVVINDDRTMVDLLAEFLSQSFVKDQAEICEENIDPFKIETALDENWDKAAQSIRLVKKSSTLKSSLRMNLKKRVNKVVAVLCRYVFLIQSAIPNDEDPGLIEYKKVKQQLLNDINKAIEKLEASQEKNLSKRAGIMVLVATLRDFKDRIEGNYTEGDNKYFYVNFLRNDKVILDDDYLPVLVEVPELPDFSVRNRIIQHFQETEREWGERLTEIVKGEDDYGSAVLILKYVKIHGIELDVFDIDGFSFTDAILYPQKDSENKRAEFIEDLELAQMYGQIDNTVENSKESMLQVMETWFTWANETKNYGFFAKILNQFKEKIHKDAQARAVELECNLSVYLEKTPNWEEDELIFNAVQQVRDRIEKQNYAAAEDLLNRLLTKDLDFDVDLQQTDYLTDFLDEDEYEANYRRTANSKVTLKSLVNSSKINKDTKGANRLLESWPRGAGVGENTLRQLLNALGFTPAAIKAEAPLQGKIESYLVNLKRPQNGRKSNYKHPISAFGSEAEDKGFRVVCLFGKTDATRLIDTFKEIGNAQNTLVLLDYALILADRRTLARKTKTDLSGKIFAVIDRVVLIYLAKHYMETAINRMLMSIIMPFASYQPYIDKSADVMPQEIFIGRKAELEKIESSTGVNIVYGGRQLGKTALLRMAKKDIDKDENGDRAIIINAWRKNYRETAKAISEALYDERILKKENITEDWSELARDIKNRLRDKSDPIPYFLLMIDEADTFIDSCEDVGYQPFNELKDIQSIGSGRFKFVVAGLRNIVRFKRQAALSNNSVLTHLDSLTVKPFKAMEARELLEVPLSYLGFRFPKNNDTEVLISTIFGTTNYFPGLIQLYCTKLIEAMRRDYAGYAESETPPYYVQKEHIKKVLAEQTLQQDIREKFFITLKVGDDDYYYIIALLAAYHYHDDKSHNGCTAKDLLTIADEFEVRKLTALDEGKVNALMEEMTELNVLQHTGDDRYRFTRHSFCQMMGNMQQIEDDLLNHYMEA